MSGKQTNLDILLEHDFDIRTRTIFLSGEVDSDSTKKFIKILMFMDKTVGEIIVIMNSEGGDVSSGFAIYDTIKDCQNEVVIKVVGISMSIATIILQAGDKRIMTKYSRLMIHRGSMEIEGHFTDVQRAVDENAEMDKICIDIYHNRALEKNPDFKRSRWRKLMDFDSYFSADKCLELGLIDEIIGGSED